MNNDSLSPEGFLMEVEPSQDFDEQLVSAGDQVQTDAMSVDEGNFLSPTLCRYNCDDKESIDTDSDRMSSDQSQLPVVDQPEPETVPDKHPTDSKEDYPERMEFVVHVDQGTDNRPSSSHHHHHHQSVPTASSSSTQPRRHHHRLPCRDNEKRQRQCLNGGRCFAIQLHNGIRRSGCRYDVCSILIFPRNKSYKRALHGAVVARSTLARKPGT